MNIAHRSRIYLIRIAKVLPFAICFIIAISYIDCLQAIIFENYVYYDNAIILNTPLNWMIANYFEYGVFVILVSILLSTSTETCVYNKISIVYAIINLAEKAYITFELDIVYVYIIIILNILIATFLVYKGFKRIKFC